MEHRADHMVRVARSRTGNANYNATSGVAQRDFVQFLNDAQDRIYNKLLQTRSSLFQKQAYLGTTQGVAAVPLPEDDIYLGHNVVSVLYSYNGNAINYAPLELRTVRQEVSVQGYPSSYFLLDDDLILSPIPSNTVSNALKVTYQKVVPDLDIRRGLISSHTLGTITLTSDATLITETANDLSNGWVDYISVVDRDGTQLVTGLSVESYDSTTLVISLSDDMTSAQSTAITNALGNRAYVVFGKNATTNSWLPKVCERFLVEYTVLRAQMRDSNKEAADTSPLLLAIEKEILDAVEELEEDISAIPIIDNSMINYADEL